MTSERREDRYPLLFVVNMGGDSLEKLPLDATPSVRDRNVTRGAATLISRWPQHVQTTSRLAFFTAFSILCMSFFMVVVIFYTSDFTFGEGFGFRAHPKRRLAMCNLDKSHGHESVYDGDDVDAVVRYMTPLQRAWEFLSDEEKIFFVMAEGDRLSPGKRCAVESAARANPNASVYLLLLADHPPSVDLAEEEAAFNGSVRVVYVDAARYLADTPLTGPASLLAARLVTLWRFGGLSLDADLLSLRPARLPRRRTKTAHVDPAGRVLSVRHPCHAFMFQAMKVLDRMNASLQEPDAATVLTAAQDLYCRKPHCRNRSGNSGKCPGFKVLPKEFICSLQHQPDNDTCVWASLTPQDTHTKYFNDLCAISSNSQPNPSLV